MTQPVRTRIDGAAEFRIGFTGSERGLTDRQVSLLPLVLHRLHQGIRGPITHTHDGDCVGGDDIFRRVVLRYREKTSTMITAISHPGHATLRDPLVHNPLRAYNAADLIHPPKPYLARDDDIARQCDVLIACPDRPEQNGRPGGGVWATVRYARKHGKPVIILWP